MDPISFKLNFNLTFVNEETESPIINHNVSVFLDKQKLFTAFTDKNG